MGKALELITGTVTAPGGTLTALTAASGNTFTIRNAPEGADIRLVQAWVDSQASGIFRIRSPRLHDNVQGIRLRHVASEVDPLLPMDVLQKLYPQDTLTVELSGSATAGDIETACLLVYYSDLPGIEGRFITPEDLKTRSKNILTVETQHTAGTSGGYSGEKLINADFDLLKGNTDYAILGYHVDAEVACVRYRSSDFGNLGLGGPGNDTDKNLTGEWFILVSKLTGEGMIPVFNSANASSLFVDLATDENGGTVNISTILAELS